MIKGYWNRDDANAESFSDDWLKTGDIAYLDEEGYLFIVDRLKDLVIRGGENIGCAEVEAALLSTQRDRSVRLCDPRRTARRGGRCNPLRARAP